jgi:hypothetical protein
VATNNALFTSDFTLTAILDFDFSFIAYPQDDILRTLHAFSGNYPYGPLEYLAPEEKELRVAIEQGFTDTPFAPELLIAKKWDEALAQRNAPRPSTVQGLSELGEVMWLADQIATRWLCTEWLIERMGPEKVKDQKKTIEGKIIGWLEGRGF